MYNQHWSKICVNNVFDADWKEWVEDSVSRYSCLSEETGDILLDKQIKKGEIEKCLRKLKITRWVTNGYR